VLAGAFVAPTEDKLRQLLRVPDAEWLAGASSADRTKQLAAAAPRATGSNWAIAVGEIQRDKSGAASVEVTFQQPHDRSESQLIPLRGTGESARSRLVTSILDQLRRRLTGLTIHD